MNKLIFVACAVLMAACSTTPRIEAKKDCQGDAYALLLDTAAPGITTHLYNKRAEAEYQACMKAKGF